MKGMSRFVFNCIIVVICVVAIIGIGIIIPHEYKKSVKKGWKVIKILGCILSVAIALLMFLSLDWSGNACTTGQLKKVHTRGSFAGIYNRYEITIQAENGKLYTIQSIAPTYGKSMREIDKMSVDSSYKVYGSTITKSFFYAITPTSEIK